MAKEYENATLICIILTLVAAAGIGIAIWKNLPIAIAAALVPAVIYEVYRTEGMYTKLASVGLLGLLVLEIVLILNRGNAVIAQYVKKAGAAVKNTGLPAGALPDASVIIPAVMVLLSFMLIRRTGGKYTMWLAGIILVSSLALIYSLDPAIIDSILKMRKAAM